MQVFGVTHINDAKKFMSFEKDPKIIRSMDQVKEICKNINFNSPQSTIDKIQMINKLEEIKIILPEYENVSFLLDILKNKYDANITEFNSTDILFKSLDKILTILNQLFIENKLKKEPTASQPGNNNTSPEEKKTLY